MLKRPANEGRVYVRRSDDKQEDSLRLQIRWANAEAPKQGIDLNVSLDELQAAVALGEHHRGQCYIDDDIPGSVLNRPGFSALRREVQENPNISHVFIYKRDRLARPDDPIEAITIEREFTKAGVTLVFEGKIVTPKRSGERDIGEDLQALAEYEENTKYIKKLSLRVIDAQRFLAERGFRTGGRAPYGFARFLIDPNGNIVQRLEDGRSVRQAGYHVAWLPDDEEKISVWLKILDFKHAGWGTKRIAKYLNDHGIPSPNAGAVRRSSGIPRIVQGKWSHNTVKSLCENAAILGMIEYGRRSEGWHHRLGSDGARLLDDHDYGPTGKPKVILNDEALLIRTPSKMTPLYDTKKFDEIQEQMAARRTSQAGITRSRDPGKYPLATRVIDLTDGCGSIMYGRTHHRSRLYGCGRYMRTSGAECHWNAIDGEILLRFVLKALARIMGSGRCREKLRSKLAQLASTAEDKTGADQEISRLQAQLAKLTRDFEVISHRMAREQNDARYEILAAEFDGVKADKASVEKLLAEKARADESRRRDPQAQVEAAMALLDDVDRIIRDPRARSEVSFLLKRLGLFVGLNFGPARSGRRKGSRALQSGVIALGAENLPVPIHGRENAAHQKNETYREEENSTECSESSGPDGSRGDYSSNPLGLDLSRYQEAHSFTKDNRGGRI